MQKLLLTLGAIAAYFLLGHVGLLAILLYVWATAMTSTTNTAKTRALAAQHAALVTAVGTTNTNVTALQNGNTGFANTLGYGPTSTANVGVTSGPDGADTGNYSFSTGPQIGGAAAHVHNGTLPNLPNANHTHDFGGHTHDFGGHAHPVT